MGIKKGTKLTDKPKDIYLHIRIDEETESKINRISERDGLSKSEIIRKGIELQYKETAE